MPSSFVLTPLPTIIFGSNCSQQISKLITPWQAEAVLVVTGGNSYLTNPAATAIYQQIADSVVAMHHVTVAEEPSPKIVDNIVTTYYPHKIALVIAIGGGSVMDCAKAVAGLLPFGNSVLDHLEDVGNGIPYTGPALPLIAIPTTAGTGSEVTKNAVLSEHGSNGYKKSFRHKTLIPHTALVDPTLLRSCPQQLLAANGLDAFTQLLESYLSVRANGYTDALALDGMEQIIANFTTAWYGGSDTTVDSAREAIAYGALISGITLSQVGLGSVHGLAQPLGSLFPVPHGIACGATLESATKMNINALQQRDASNIALQKYARVGKIVQQFQFTDVDPIEALLQQINQWTETFRIASLADFGISSSDISAIVANSRGNSMKTNPILLTDAEIGRIVIESL